MSKYSVIDLFAGAGGLSLGFMQTQKYDIKVAMKWKEEDRFYKVSEGELVEL